MKKYAVIVAGGSGARMESAIPKQFLLLQDKPVLWHTLTAFLTAFDDILIILVLPETYIETGVAIINTTAVPHRIQVVAGGPTRYQSVQNGLKLVEKKSIVFVHDGVRCLVTPGLIQRCYHAAMEKGNAVPAIAAVDSIRIIRGDENEVIDRNRARMIQTPQTFSAEILLPAFAQAYTAAFTDEATVVEKQEIRIHLIDGEITNIKITKPIDLLVAAEILRERILRTQ